MKLVTVACEEEGALPFIREISQVCTVSLGHTTADYDTAMAMLHDLDEMIGENDT